ncbi:hypothetical protein [Aquibium microcysteis]|uniref:hypothetical protein n=1 Tax=Aquibium microcysteis TaxID=675281 RepID=UPI003B84A87D
MNDRDSVADRQGRLSQAIREIRIAAAEREDVVVDMREAARMRLELLAQELAPVFAEVPDEEILFDFAISSGLQPRLWIDAVSHVAMGRDRRTYRFVRDTRMGRIVLAESTDMRPVAQQVTRYIAERMVERQRWLDGPVEPVLAQRDRAPANDGSFRSASRGRGRQSAHGDVPPPPRDGRQGGSLLSYASRGHDAEEELREEERPYRMAPRPGRLRAFLSGAGVVLAGALAGLAVLAAVYYDRITAYFASN